jgi:hypothetical protein
MSAVRRSGGVPDLPPVRSTPERLPSVSSRPPISGSHFSCLLDVEAEDDRIQALVEEVAWCGIEDEPLVPPVVCRPDIPLVEVAADFWSKIGYPMPESRSWERSCLSGKTKVSNDMSVLCRARSLSPVKTGRVRDLRASSSVPVGMHLAKPPRMGAWRGPLPRRRVTPLPVLGDFMTNAKVSPADVSCSFRGSGQRGTSEASTVVLPMGRPVLAAVAPPCSDQAGVIFEGRRCWAATTADGSICRWGGLGRAILAAKHCRVLPLPRLDVAAIAHLANAAPLLSTSSPHHRRHLPRPGLQLRSLLPLPATSLLRQWLPIAVCSCRWLGLRLGRRRLQMRRWVLFLKACGRLPLLWSGPSRCMQVLRVSREAGSKERRIPPLRRRSVRHQYIALHRFKGMCQVNILCSRISNFRGNMCSIRSRGWRRSLLKFKAIRRLRRKNAKRRRTRLRVKGWP